MQINNNAQTLYDRGWIVRIQPPALPAPRRIMLLLHGWTGDETVMWVFARSLPDDFLMLAPRGPVPTGTSLGGFGWVKDRPGSAREFAAYAESGARLMDAVGAWAQERGAGGLPLHLMGFSQGAALAYTLLIQYPDRVASMAALAGLVPNGAEKALQPGLLAGKPVLITHGARDETVPVQKAREAAELFSRAGADVTYCEDDSGHKLGPGCHKRLASFFANPETRA